MTPFLTPQAIHIAPSITALLSDKDGVKSVPAASETASLAGLKNAENDGEFAL